MNYELNDPIKNADIVRIVKSKRMAWLGHVIRMEGKRIPKKSTRMETNKKEKQKKTKEKMD